MSLFHNSVLLGASGQGGTLQLEKSVRFNKADTPFLNRTMSGGDRGKATISCWLKKCNIHSITSEYIYLMGVSSECSVYISSNDKLRFDFYHTDGSTWAVIANSNMVFSDVSSWYHIVLSIDSSAGTTNADRVKLYVNGVQQYFTFATYGTGTITGDIKHLNQSGQTFQINSRPTKSYYGNFYLANYHYIDGQALNATSFGAFDSSGVWQAAAYSGTFGTNGFHLFDFANESGIGNDSSGNDNDFTVNNLVSGVYVGTKPKWYTSTTLYTTKADVIANATDRGQSAFTLSSEEFVYLVPNNGGAVGELCHPVGSQYPVLYYVYARSSGDTSWYNTGSYGVGEADLFQWENTTGTPQSYDFTNTEDLYLIGDTRVGGQPDANSKMSGSFPALVNLVGETDLLRDVPTNGDSSDDTGVGGEVSGNYCTWHALDKETTTLSNGNLDAVVSLGSDHVVRGTFAVSSGKWYWEVEVISGSYGMIGISNSEKRITEANYSNSEGGLFYYVQTGTLYGYLGGSFSDSSYGSGLSAGDIIGVALDMDNGNLKFFKNGTDLGHANSTSLSGFTVAPSLGEAQGADFSTSTNFGQRAFAYSAPSGYKALCTTNLPDPTITDGSTAFDVVLYSSDGNARTISGLNMSPDLVWSKRRSSAGRNVLTDSVRGVNKELFPNRTDAERTSTNGLTAFNSDGYTLGTDSGQYGWQANGQTFVNWAWDAGSSTVSNTDGDMTSSVRVNQSAGFSIVKWTSPSGTTPFAVGHGLNTAPSFIITKCITNASGWYCYHESLDATNPQNKYLQLNATHGALTSASSWGTSKPNSTTFGDRHLNWAGGDDIIAYCFSPVDQFSSFGVYVGNGSTSEGPFINTGFRPALVIFKRIDTSASASWYIYDYKRIGYNPENSVLYPNTSDAEAASTNIHLLSNGFRLIGAGGDSNASGGSYIYMAWAQNPFSLNGGIAR